VSSVQHNDSYTGFVGVQVIYMDFSLYCSLVIYITQDRASPTVSPSVSPRSTPPPTRRATNVTQLDSGIKPPKPSMPPPRLNVAKKYSVDSTARPHSDHISIPKGPVKKDSRAENGNFRPSDILRAQKATSPPMFSNPVFAGKPAPPPKKSLSSGSLGNSSSSDDTSGVCSC